MSDLRDLYQETILDHTKRPRNKRAMNDANRTADGHNRLCGDKLKLFVKIENGRIADAAFEGSGCAISTASASMMTETLKGKTVAEAEALYHKFHEVLTGPPDETPDVPELGKLAVFAGVREFPVRVKCATLPWHTLQAALKDDHTPVSTE
jgi:nitrogen fixation NifU-like protein